MIHDLEVKFLSTFQKYFQEDILYGPTLLLSDNDPLSSEIIIAIWEE